VAITRVDLSADNLRREAARSRDANAARRMLAIALVLEGQSREDAAEARGGRGNSDRAISGVSA
jgi:putative transposase